MTLAENKDVRVGEKLSCIYPSLNAFLRMGLFIFVDIQIFVFFMDIVEFILSPRRQHCLY